MVSELSVVSFTVLIEISKNKDLKLKKQTSVFNLRVVFLKNKIYSSYEIFKSQRTVFYMIFQYSDVVF